MMSACGERWLLFRLERLESICTTLMAQSQSHWQEGLEQPLHTDKALLPRQFLSWHDQVDWTGPSGFPPLLQEAMPSYAGEDDDNSLWPQGINLPLSPVYEPRPLEAAAIPDVDDFGGEAAPDFLPTRVTGPLPSCTQIQLDSKLLVDSMAIEDHQLCSQSASGYLEPSVLSRPHIRANEDGGRLYPLVPIPEYRCEATNCDYFANSALSLTQDGEPEKMDLAAQQTTKHWSLLTSTDDEVEMMNADQFARPVSAVNISRGTDSSSDASAVKEVKNGASYQHSIEYYLASPHVQAGQGPVPESYHFHPLCEGLQPRYESREAGFHQVEAAGKVDQYIIAMGHVFEQFISRPNRYEIAAMITSAVLDKEI